MPKTQLTKEPDSVRTRKVEITMPEGLYDLLEKVCKIQERSVNEFMLNSAAGYLDIELQEHLGFHFDFTMKDGAYRDSIESLAYPEAAAQEVQV